MQLKAIADQVVVITGATSGIGLATAMAASAAGARVVLAARDEMALERVVARITAQGGSAMHVVADVSREDDVERISQAAIQHFGGFDTWFNNAGVAIFGKVEAVSIEDHRRLFETNYWGVVHGSLVALRHLRQRGGALINMGSMLSDVVTPLQGPYNASKHAIKGLTDTLRIELVHDGAPVSVTLVKPASINTPLPEHARNYLPMKPMLPPPAYEPELVAQAVLRAAQYPIRDLVIGATAPFLTLGNHAMPAVADRLSATTMFSMQQSRSPALGQDSNLYRPTLAGRTHGNHPCVFKDSPYTRLTSRQDVTRANQLASGLVAAPLTTCGKAAVILARAFLRHPGKPR